MYEDIKQQFAEVISYSQGIPDPQIDELFNNWLRNKKAFIDAFGGKLIYEGPEVEFELSKDTKEEKVKNFIESIYTPELKDFVSKFKDDFFTNILPEPYEAPDGTILPKGMKITKAYKHFTEDRVGAIQQYASRILQENKVRGTLCLSVHPLDFLSTSNNNYNWSSCHSLDGEYRSGNLAYMSDSTTIVAYLRGADNVPIELFPCDVKWNSKKWRSLIFFSQDWELIFAGRQYPFSSDSALSFVKTLIEKFSLKNFEKWSNSYITDINDVKLYKKYFESGRRLHSLEDIIVDNCELFYNDLTRSQYYKKPYYMNSTTRVFNSRIAPMVYIGEEVKCLSCGNEIIYCSESMMCDNCEIKYGSLENDRFCSCSQCGERGYTDDFYWIDYRGEMLCPRCYNDEIGICECCGEYFYKNDLIRVINEDDSEEYWCEDCYENER